MLIDKGLTPPQVLASRAAHGANILTPPPPTPLWRQLARKFTDPLIVILLIAGVLSFAISCYEYYALCGEARVFFDSVGIFVAILLATGLAFYFEMQADREFAILNKVTDDEPVTVRRDGTVCSVPRRDVVVGDIVLLAAGQEVPADCELLSATDLNVDESTLTGEPVCRKSTNDTDTTATYAPNRVMRGTRIIEGHATARVLAVGDSTEQGRVFTAVQIDRTVRIPLDDQLDRLSRWITIASYAIAVLIIIGRTCEWLITEPFDLVPFVAYELLTLMIAATLVVVAVPEGLPMAVTLSLAYSMRRMLRTNNLVRRLHACVTMGAANVICTDKTGTLTTGQMAVSEMRCWGCGGVGFRPHAGDVAFQPHVGDLLPSIALNSTAELSASHRVLGNPTEGALLLWLEEQGCHYADLRRDYQIEQELPFSPQRKHMATVARTPDGRRQLYVKGAPEIVAAMCAQQPQGLQQQLDQWEHHAMRTLGFAACDLEEGEQPISAHPSVPVREISFSNCALAEGGKGPARAEGGTSPAVRCPRLRFIAACAIADPVRPEVPAAVRECQDAGIEVKIVTGDTAGTAREIGRQVGLWTDADNVAQAFFHPVRHLPVPHKAVRLGSACGVNGASAPAGSVSPVIITGPDFAALSDEELDSRVDSLKIICRARPMDKQRLVQALQRRGHVVAVTGDGTNDAPALKAAHVGLSMGSGTSVAKEASDITIIDNSFASIGRAVMWGRSLYQNIQRFLLFQLTVNVTACLLVLCGAFMGTESPLTVTQMLWINLIMDTFAAMALASLPPAERVMRDKPRNRKAFILTRPMLKEIVGVGTFFFVLLLAMLYVFQHADVRSMLQLFTVSLGPKDHVSTYELTLLFTVFVMTHFFYLFCARAYATGRSALHFRGCKGLLTIAAIIFAGQVAMVELPVLQQFFNVCSLSLTDWIIIIAASSLVLWVREAWHRLETCRHR